VRITKAEDGGMDSTGVWEPATTGMSPGNESATMERYLTGDYLT
jgi:nitrate reductase alpha subunit